MQTQITLFWSRDRESLEPGMFVIEGDSERNYHKHLCNVTDKFRVWGMTLGYRK